MNHIRTLHKVIRTVKRHYLWFLLLSLLINAQGYAQGYIKHSRVIGGTGNQTVVELIVDGGSSYVLATTTGNDYPITLGGVPAGTLIKTTLSKLDASGNIEWSRYLPFGNGFMQYADMVLLNGVIYLAGGTEASNLAVTDGSVYKGLGDIVFTKVDAATGAVLTNGYLGGSGGESTGGIRVVVENGYAYLTYLTSSGDIPVTSGQNFTGGGGANWDRALQKLDPTGNPLYTITLGRVGSGAVAPVQWPSLKVVQGIAYMAFPSLMVNFVTTDGSTPKGSYDIGLVRLDPNGNRNLATIVGGSGPEGSTSLLVHNGEMYVAAVSASPNYPITDGSSIANGTAEAVLTKLDANGNILFSGAHGFATGGIINVYSFPTRLLHKDGSLYLAFGTATGNINIAATDNSTGSNALVKLNATTGAVQFATRFGEVRAGGTVPFNIDVEDAGDAIYTASEISIVMPGSGGYTTDGSVRNGRSGTYVAKHGFDGKLLYGAFLTTTSSSATPGGEYQIAGENGKLYVSGTAFDAVTWPVTTSPLGPTPSAAQSDVTWTVLEFCPPVPTTNNITPLSQSICQNAMVQGLTGNEVVYPSSLVPVIYINNSPRDQMEIRPRYQWQSSTSTSGPWINILAGTQRDYIPPTAAQTLYYRRLVLPPLGCGDDPVSISPVAEVIIGANAAPNITGGIFNTCVGSPVNISATVTGGTAPYTYTWDNGVSSTTNSATVTPTANSVYTLTVTDANNCQQIGQVIVNAYAADAGPASVSVCAGKAARLGTTPPAGLSGVIYQWSPATGLDDPTAAQPLATPGATTIYTVQMTVPVSGGGTCTTSDNITVNVDAGPATAQFAGPDNAVAKGGTVNIGTPAEVGFTYTWSPGSYLANVTASTTTFSAGSDVPSPNPYHFTLTAARGGCTFTDQVSVTVLDVDAGDDYCGPRTVGTADYLPGVTGKTYLWQVISGPGTITGATNTATTTVSASSTNTTYRVTLSYLGVDVSDDVVVGPCGSGGCPNVDIEVIASHGCPNTTLGAVTLKADPANLSPAAWAYTWSSVPAGGLSATTGNQITLTDNVERDITVTISRVDNPSVSCSKTIHVNDPSWALPVFNVSDKSACSSTPVSIGTTGVSGYTYTWENVAPADIHASNPSVSPTVTTVYPVMVEEVASGCRLLDTVKVLVKPLIINPGANWVACSNALITLGSPAKPGYTYTWSPQVAAYQNGSNYQSAMPQLLVAATQNFTLTVTDTETGCTDDSTITITIDGNTTLPPMTNPTICKGGSTTIGLPVMSGVTYSWSPAVGLSSTTVAQPTASPNSTQVYTLNITYYDAGGAPACTKTGNVTVFVSEPTITMSDESICPSGALYNLSNGVTVGGATSYAWSPAILVTNPNALSTTVKTNPNAPTTFTLTAKNADGCTATASKVVGPVNAAPDAGGSGFVCVGDSKTLGNPANTGTLNWSVSPAIAGTLSSMSGAETVFTPAAGDAGKTFTFTITQNISGCINTDKVQVQVKSVVLPAMPVQTVCLNASLTIGVPAQQGVTYAWTPATSLSDATAATTTVNNITGTTKYTLTAVDAFGCAAKADAIVGVNPTPSPTVTIPDVTVGRGTAGTPFNPQVSPMPADYVYTWTPPTRLNDPYVANATALPAELGTTTYTLSVTDDNGCTTSAQVDLNVVAYNQDADVVAVKTLKDASKTSYIPGEDVVYTITVTNNGPGTAYNVNVGDVAPAGTSITSWTATVTSGNVTLPNTSGTGNLNETIAELPYNSSVTYEVAVRTTASMTGTLSNTVAVTASTTDPDPTCLACTTPPLPKAAVADIVTLKTLKNAGQTQFIPGQPVVYAITVTNNGPDDASNVVVIDNAPAGTTINSWIATVVSGSVTLPNSNGTGNINETIASFPNGAVVTYEVSVQTPDTFTGNLINTAQVSTITYDPDNTCAGCTAPPVTPIPPPVANNNDTTAKDGIPVVIRVLDNDSPGPSGSPLAPATIEIVTQPVHGTVIVNADGTISYTNNTGYTGNDSFTYRVKDENGLWSNVATVTITVLKNEIHVPNILTANGDGKNDKLIIRGLEKYQNNTLLIFNRWNNKVYESKNYQGDWNGKGLNPGTYFYTLRLQDTNGQWHTVNGYITLIR